MKFEAENYSHYYRKDIFRLIKWILALIILIYSPIKVLSILILLIILILFYKSKTSDDFFWITLVFLIIDYVGNLFFGIDRGFLNIGVIQFDYLILFSIVAFVKVINKRKQYSNFPELLKKPYIIYLIYFIFLLLYGISFYGLEGGGETGMRHYYNTFRLIAMLPIFYSLSIIFYRVDWLPRFANLLFFLLIINFFSQLFSIFSKTSIHYILGGIETEDTELLLITKDLIRPIFGSFINLISLLLGSYYYFQGKNYFRKNYLISVLIVVYASIFMTASRTWIVGYILFLIVLVIVSIFSKYYKSMAFKFVFIAIPISIILLSYTDIRYQVESVLLRVSTLELLYKGDLTAGGTNIRFTSRPERVMSKFDENSLLGWGISNVSYDYWDGHVGNQSIMLVGGLIGIIIFGVIWLFFLFKLLRQSINGPNVKNKLSIFVLFLFFVLTLIIHFGTQRYGFLIWGLSPTTAFVTAIWMSIIADLYQLYPNIISNFKKHL